MNDFSWLKKYSHNEKDFFQERPNDKHSFFKISTLEVEEQEKKLGRKFPGELRDFYLQIGAGSLCVNDHENFGKYHMDTAWRSNKCCLLADSRSHVVHFYHRTACRASVLQACIHFAQSVRKGDKI